MLQDPNPKEKKIFTLSKLTQAIENVINTYCSKEIWVKAEIVKLNYYRQSGHCFPDLVEKQGDRIIAQIRGNIWKTRFEAINTKFQEVLGEPLKDNMMVVLRATVQFHSVYGISVNISDIDPFFTLGELARQKAATIERLKREEIFEANSMTFFPQLPKTIALISVETSKGYEDFMEVILKNPWGYKYHIKLFPAILQGERAVPTIMEQLENIRKYSGVFDAVAIIRGGGGDIGLSCYDNYHLAKCIATFPIPILTGIGHASNETVSDLVSYKSFITPTKIAEFLLQKFHDFAVPLEETELELKSYAKWVFERERRSLRETSRLFNSLTGRFLDTQKNKLAQTGQLLKNFKGQTLTAEHNLLNLMQRSLRSSYRSNVSKALQDLHFTEEKLRLLSPLQVLKRGYSITLAGGKIVKDPAALHQGMLLETHFFEGTVESKIENITLNNKKKNG